MQVTNIYVGILRVKEKTQELKQCLKIELTFLKVKNLKVEEKLKVLNRNRKFELKSCCTKVTGKSAEIRQKFPWPLSAVIAQVLFDCSIR